MKTNEEKLAELRDSRAKNTKLAIEMIKRSLAFDGDPILEADNKTYNNFRQKSGASQIEAARAWNEALECLRIEGTIESD